MILRHKPKRKKKRSENKNEEEEEEDKLSNLPDSIIHHILSFLNTKEAFQTCVLSTRWNYLTKHLPTLRLTSKPFNSIDTFTKSLSRILSLRDESTPLHTLDFVDQGVFVEPEVLNSVVEYAVSHRVQVLRITITCQIHQLPSCLFSSQTLTSLDLSIHVRIGVFNKVYFPNSLNLPALTTLAVRFFHFRAGDDGCARPFSTFKKLNTLVIESFRLVEDAETLCISSDTLVNLTMYGYGFITNASLMCNISAPSLSNFSFIGSLNQKPCHIHLCSVKHVYIDADIGFNRPVQDESAVLLNWLLQFSNIKSLTVSSDTLQVLSFLPNLFKVKLSSLCCNLESLQVEMKPLSPKLHMILSAKYMDQGTKFHMSTNTFIPKGVVDFLLQNSPSAKVNIIWYNKSSQE